MAYTPVIPSEYQQDRQDLHDVISAIMDAFIASENGQVGRAYAASFPASLQGELPLIVMGDIEEAIVHTTQLRITTFTGTVWYVDRFPEREAYSTRVNTWADRMRDLFTANGHIVLDDGLEAEMHQTTVQEGELRQGNVVFGAPGLTFVMTVQRGYTQG